MDSARDGPSIVPENLIDACLKAAAEGDYWRVQRRLLEALPEAYANRLLQLLLDRGMITAAALNLFKYSVSAFTAPAALRGTISAEWLSYLADFRLLSALDLSLCVKLKDVHLAPLQHLHHCLQHLTLQGCKGITAKLGPTLSHLTSLRTLDLSDTGITQPITPSLAALTQLSSLNLGGLPTSNKCCGRLTGLKGLESLVLWGSQVTSGAFPFLAQLPALAYLDVSWSSAEALPILQSLTHLKMTHCTVSGGWSEVHDLRALGDGQLTCVDLTGTQIQGEGWLVVEELLSWSTHDLQVLNLSGTRFSQVHLLQTMHRLRELNISSCQLQSPHSLTALLGASSLTHLSIGDSPLRTEAAATISLLPKLQALALQNAGLQDTSLPWLLYLTSLTSLSLNNNPSLSGRLLPSPSSDPNLTPEVTGPILLDLPDELLPCVAESAAQGRVKLPQEVWVAARSAGAHGTNIWAADTSAAEDRGEESGRYTHVFPPTVAMLQTGWSCLGALVKLELGGTSWSNEGCQGLRGHTALEELFIGSKAMKDRGLVALANLPNLIKLKLKEVRATDRAWAFFDQHPSLKELHIEECPLMTRSRLQVLMEEVPHLALVTENGAVVEPATRTPAGSRRSASNFKAPSPSALSQSPVLSSSPIIPLDALHLQAYDQRFKYDRQELLDVRSSIETIQESTLPEEVDTQLPLEIRPRKF